MEKRKYPRMGMSNLSVDVADGAGIFLGMVSDISRNGLSMTDLPKRLNGSVIKMTIVVSAQGRRFKMNVSPRWYSDEGSTKSVGAEVFNPPPNWIEFVTNVEPILHDVWGKIRL
jgi:hypothetical protein